MQMGQRIACASWASVKPRPSSSVVFVPQLKAHLCSGDFVKLRSGEVAVVIDIKH